MMASWLVGRQISGSCRGIFFTFKQLHDDGEKDRSQKNAENRDPDHPAEHGGSDGLAHFRTGSCGVDKRENAKGEGE